jgi:hypothetical protein
MRRRATPASAASSRTPSAAVPPFSRSPGTARAPWPAGTSGRRRRRHAPRPDGVFRLRATRVTVTRMFSFGGRVAGRDARRRALRSTSSVFQASGVLLRSLKFSSGRQKERRPRPRAPPRPGPRAAGHARNPHLIRDPTSHIREPSRAPAPGLACLSAGLAIGVSLLAATCLPPPAQDSGSALLPPTPRAIPPPRRRASNVFVPRKQGEASSASPCFPGTKR